MRQYEHGGDVYRNNVRLDFSVNTNPLGMPDAVKNVLTERIDVCEKYPDPDCEELTRAIAAFEGVQESSVLCGNGAADIIYRLAFSLKPKKALVCAPSFSEYERAVLLNGGGVKYHELSERDGFMLTERILDDITADVDMVFVCNPNNPTGRLADYGLLESVADKCRETGALLVADECFLPFTDGRSLKTLPDVAVLKAFTKLYAMAGLRLGYLLCGDGTVIDGARKHAQTWSVSAPAQVAGLAALGCSDWICRTADIVATERAFLSEQLRRMGLHVFDSDANFLLIKSSRTLYRPLLERGILVRGCENFQGLDGRFIRLAVKTREENEILLAAIREVLHG